MENLRTIKDVKKEFDEKFRKGEESWHPNYESIKSFISSSLQELLEQILPEPKKFPEKESDDFDEGYEFCRQEVENRIKKILNN